MLLIINQYGLLLPVVNLLPFFDRGLIAGAADSKLICSLGKQTTCRARLLEGAKFGKISQDWCSTAKIHTLIEIKEKRTN